MLGRRFFAARGGRQLVARCRSLHRQESLMAAAIGSRTSALALGAPLQRSYAPHGYLGAARYLSSSSSSSPPAPPTFTSDAPTPEPPSQETTTTASSSPSSSSSSAAASSAAAAEAVGVGASEASSSPVESVEGGTGSSTSTPTARPTGPAEKHEFQAETRQLLDIVIHSVYTDKEVFLRELISNASDALEKLRHLQVTGETSMADPHLPLAISITTDEQKNTLSITDTGMGMSKGELVSNLGTIARSGSKAFVQQLQEQGTTGAGGIIGQFGVGFYSVFMVGDSVTVTSRSYSAEEPAHTWMSTGAGSYAVAPSEGIERGSTITIQLKDNCKEFSRPSRIKDVIKKYSNFVNFPISVNGEVVNTIRAIWLEDQKEVTEDQYKDFYRFIAGAYDEPLYRVHFRTDAPLDLKALFFIPTVHGEKYGMARLEPGVNLYSRKVLIESKCKGIFPDWLRFVKGVVDSEDLPLAISREKAQDTALLKRIQRVLVRKVLRFLEDEAKKNPEDYKTKFFKEFGHFLKEGICHDFDNGPRIAKLLYYESSALPAGEVTSFDEYISRCDPEQGAIYYLCAPNRELAEASPYFETFKRHNKEVLFVYNAVDDFVMTNLGKYNSRDFKTAETSGLDLGPEPKKDDVKEEEGGKDTEGADAKKELDTLEAEELGKWLKEIMPDRIMDVKSTSRLYDSPAIVSGHESGALRRMMSILDPNNTGKSQFTPRQHLEINPRHSIIVRLNSLRTEDPAFAKTVAEQVYDNALVAAGLLDDSRMMLPRINKLLERVLTNKQ